MNNSASTSNGSTLHEIVRAEISRRITTGMYKPGDAITSIARLAEEFGVSSITVKRALSDLQSTGLLTSIPGKGIYVKDRFRLVCELDVGMSALGNIRSLGFQPKVQRISVTKERIEDVTLSVFNPPDRLLLCVRKVIYADEVPIVYESSFVPTNMSDKIVDEFGKRFIIDALKRYKVAVKEMSFIIDAAPASQEAQRVFSVPNSYPTLRRLYNLKTSAPTMSIVGIIESPFDRLACSVRPGSGRISKMNKKK